MSDDVVTYPITNSAAASLVIFLEPWGEEYWLAPGDAVELRVEQVAAHPLEWDFGDGRLVISSFANADHSLELWKDGSKIPPR